MKKIYTSLLLGSLIFPSMLLAQEEVMITTTSAPVAQPTQGERLPPKDLLREKRDELRTTATEKKESLTRELGNRASSTPLRKEEARGQLAGRASSTAALGFCQSIDKVLTSIDTKGIKLEDKREQALTSHDNKREAVRTKVDEKRDENEAKRVAQLSELSKRATTDEQKLAIAAFTQAMNQALATKKAATDTVLSSHRKEVDTVVASRRAETEKAIATLTSSIEAAKLKAKTDCASGASGDQVRQTLRASMEKAQTEFRATVKNIEKVKDVNKSSKEAKKAELKEIEETFKASLEKAKTDLKNSLKASRAATSSTPQ